MGCGCSSQAATQPGETPGESAVPARAGGTLAPPPPQQALAPAGAHPRQEEPPERTGARAAAAGDDAQPLNANEDLRVLQEEGAQLLAGLEEAGLSGELIETLLQGRSSLAQHLVLEAARSSSPEPGRDVPHEPQEPYQTAPRYSSSAVAASMKTELATKPGGSNTAEGAGLATIQGAG